MDLHLKIRWWQVAREKTRRKAIAVTILAVAAVGIPIWISLSISRARATLERAVHDLDAELRARDRRRRPITGQASEGNAWDDYAEAFRLEPQALDALHRGAHRSRTVTPIPWHLAYEGAFPNINDAARLMRRVQARAYDL